MEDKKTGGARLNIITGMRPESEMSADPEDKGGRKFSWNRDKSRQRQETHEAGFSERLLRNSALACALLLAILAVGNIDQPWAQNTIGKVEQALTMTLDVDEAFGGIELVQNMMPEAVLTFFNVSGSDGFFMPVEGSISHAYSDDQPWMIVEGEAGCQVRACADGTVSAVSELSGGGYGVLLSHGEGLETLYAYIMDVSVSNGDRVKQGDALGSLAPDSGTAYFEMRKNGEPVDPMGGSES